MIAHRLLSSGLLFLSLCWFFFGCNKPIEPLFDNSVDPYGTTYTPRRPGIGVEQLDATAIRGRVYPSDAYTVSIIVERRIGNIPVYKRIAELYPNSWEFVDRDSIKTGTIYNYRSATMGPNGRMSDYSMTVAIMAQ